jgi:polar amino acid transport system permease protein
MDFTFWDILRNLLFAARWTVVLSIVAFVCGGSVGLLLMMLRISAWKPLRLGARLYIELFQGTPLLMQLFLVFFGLPLIGVDVQPWMAAGLGLTLSASAYLAEIWRGSVEAIPRGQWDAAAALGLHYGRQLQLVILPQAVRIAVAPTVGFLVQLVKSTALTSIIGFNELLKTSNVINNATFAPFTVYGVVALIYFALCFPLTSLARRLERRLQIGLPLGRA